MSADADRALMPTHATPAAAAPRAALASLLVLLAAGVAGAVRGGTPQPPLFIAVAIAAMLPVVLALHLRSACARPPGVARALLAGLLFIAPNAAWCAFGLLGRVSLGGLAALPLAALGLILALFALRRSLGGDDAPLPRALVVFGVAAIVVLAVVAARREARLFEIATTQERAAQERESAAPFSLDAPATLRFDNAVFARGPYRDADVVARVALGEKSIAELRVRAIEPDSAQGVALVLSTDPRFASGLWLETQEEFTLVDRAAPSWAPSSGVVDVRVECRGRTIEAFVDGRSFARVEERRFAEGAVIGLGARGAVRFDALSVQPVASDEARVLSAADAARGASAVACVALAWIFLAAGVLAASWTRIVAAAAAPALAIALVLQAVAIDGPTDDPLLVVAFALAFVLQLAPVLVLARGAGALRAGVVVAGALACVAFAGGSAVRRSWPPDFGRVNAIGVTRWSGERLEPDLVELQHPAIRRFDNWHARHELRLVTPKLEKKDGVPRVLCMGTSSTNGYWLALPYPFRIQLALEKQGFPVEVMVGAVPGSTGSRLFFDLQNTLLAWRPDVVTLSLFFNDSYALTQMDEAGYLRRVTAPGYRASWFERLRDRREAARGAALLRRAIATSAPGSTPDWPDGETRPAQRFEDVLRDFARLLAERGVALVLVQEPVAGDHPRLWKDEFRAAMNRVAAEFRLEIVDPTPSLQAKGGAKLFMDEVHPLEDGAQVIADEIAPAVRRALERRGR